ncbi:adenylosuccinate lyase, putative [Eimeria maxima]|uniref:Adenylosuccinate lyase, putative n=1 Tax=Eimeria maxima TaxID=5804 RepID=U6LYT3_EIMMA|nr:adenylosuccinate lyase, putative [Eimeria maxima]CDJ56921.1 adenylosuccinate lyase, putative [Eimeria maxima]
MSLINNICPLDGRYREATEELRKVWGDIHLMRHRVYVELKWLEFFVANVHPQVPLTPEQLRDLEPLYEVTEENLQRIFAIEKQTNHDVKAVEYYIRERLEAIPSLSSLLGMRILPFLQELTGSQQPQQHLAKNLLFIIID